MSIPDSHKLNLFLISFLTLFLELSFIRWLGAYVPYLTFFTNWVLIASFIGMSIGCMTADKTVKMLRYVPTLTFIVSSSGLIVYILIKKLELFSITVGNFLKWDRVFFGADLEPAQIHLPYIPIEVLASVFFLLIALVFIGLGQVLGEEFKHFKNRVEAYSINISGSLLGILAMALISYLQLPAPVWFALSLGIIGYFLVSNKRFGKLNAVILVCCFFVFFAADNINWISRLEKHGDNQDEFSSYWSPYYHIVQNKSTGSVLANGINHQAMMSVKNSLVYSVPYYLTEEAGLRPFEDVLIIGAGTGNDAAHALANGAKHVDAVEIDPVFIRLGTEEHPNRPYSDKRVKVYINDGRAFLHNSNKKYDLIVYAMVDSLTLQSAYSSVRLENFLFTAQAIEDVKKHLKENGIFVVYNFFREGWVISRLEQMLKKTFHRTPIIYTNPPKKEIMDTEKSICIAALLTGGVKHIKENIARNGSRLPFSVVKRSFQIRSTDDDWPFFYLKRRAIPKHNLFGLGIIFILSVFLLKRFSSYSLGKLNPHFIFLGAGFMLIETKSITQMALLFGSTWMVNCVVIASVLITILLSNLYIVFLKPQRMFWYYTALMLGLILNFFIPVEWYLSDSVFLRLVKSSIVMFLPVFFAGIIFAASFKRSLEPNIDFGANILGVVLGASVEYLSLMGGYRVLTLVAILFYALSLIGKDRQLPSKYKKGE